MFDYASFTAIGGRVENQDRFLILADELADLYLFAVADGMGGHRCGAQAAAAALAAIETRWAVVDPSLSVPEQIGLLIESAQLAVNALASTEERFPPKTTVALFVSSAQGTYSGHVGDTRVMQYAGAKLVKRTRDHSLTERKFASGDITESEMALDPDQHLITQALGGVERLDIGIVEWDLGKEDIVCLASDGAWSLLVEADYQSIAHSRDLDKTTQSVLTARLKTAPASQDNTTLIVLRKSSGASIKSQNAGRGGHPSDH